MLYKSTTSVYFNIYSKIMWNNTTDTTYEILCYLPMSTFLKHTGTKMHPDFTRRIEFSN